MHGNYQPIPPRLLLDMRVVQHDLHQLRANLAAGRVRPAEFAAIERAMAARIEILEAAVHARLLDEARAGARARRVRGMN
jgi:hypothetical protein